VSASIAELGTMKVTRADRRDGNPRHRSAALSRHAARVIACIIMLPVLTIFADVLAILGGMFVANVYRREGAHVRRRSAHVFPSTM
jgi:hypothetical protein